MIPLKILVQKKGFQNLEAHQEKEEHPSNDDKELHSIII